MNRDRVLKKLPGGKGIIDESSVVDVGLLLLRKAEEPPKFARPTLASALKSVAPKLPREPRKLQPKPEPEKPEPPHPQDLEYELVTEDNSGSLLGDEKPVARYVYEEYVFGEKGKEPSGAHYTYKEEYESKPRKERIQPVTTQQPKVVKSRYMQFKTEAHSRPRSAEPTPLKPLLARDVKSFEQAVRFDNHIEKLQEEITAKLVHFEDGPHTTLNGVEISMPIDWNAVLGIDYRPASPVKKIYNAGVNGLSPKTLNEKLKKKKHLEANKRLYENIKKVESKYARDKQMKEYKEAKQRAPEPRFPPPKKSRCRPKRAAVPAPVAGPSRSRAAPQKKVKSGPNMSRPAMPLFIAVATSLFSPSKLNNSRLNLPLWVPPEERLLPTPPRAVAGPSTRPPPTISNYLGNLHLAYERPLRSPSEITRRAKLMIEEYRKDVQRGKFY